MSQKTLRDYGIELRNENVGQHTTTCPQCRTQRKKKNAPCLSVKIDGDGTIWNCHHCGWSGSLRDGVAGRSGDEHWKPPVWERPKLAQEENWTQRARTFFYERKIFDDTLARNKIFVAKDHWIPQLEGRHDAIAFPYFRLGECINVKYRGPKDDAGNKTLVLHYRAERIFYGLDDIITGKDTGELGVREWAIVVEGEMDKLAMEEAGFVNVLSPPNGAPSAVTKNLDHFFEFIEASNIKFRDGDKEGAIDKIGRFVIAVDADDAGKRLQDELVRRLGPQRCSVVTWPKIEGKQLKDANEVLIELGPQAIRDLIMSAKPMPIAGVFRAEDLDEEIKRYYEHGLPPGLSTGWSSFRTEAGKELYTVELGRITLLGGIPQHGKSSWLEQLMVHLAQEHGWSFAIHAPETQPLELAVANMMEKWAGKPFARGYTTRMDEADLVDAQDFVNRHFWWMLSEEELFTVQDVLDRADILVRQHGVKGLVIDPWNALRHERKRDETVDQYVGRTIQKIRQWTRIRKVWTVITAHPTKMEKVRGKDPVPTPYDVKGASEWFDMMDFCLTVWRDVLDETKPTQVHVQKVKFRHLGALGVALLNYDKPTGRLYSGDGAKAQSVKIKSLNSEDNPIFDRPPVQEEAPWWIDKD